MLQSAVTLTLHVKLGSIYHKLPLPQAYYALQNETVWQPSSALYRLLSWLQRVGQRKGNKAKRRKQKEWAPQLLSVVTTSVSCTVYMRM